MPTHGPVAGRARGCRRFSLSLAWKEIDELKSVREDYEMLMTKYKAKNYLQAGLCLFEDDVLLEMPHASVPLDEPVMTCKVNKLVNTEFKRYR